MSILSTVILSVVMYLVPTIGALGIGFDQMGYKSTREQGARNVLFCWAWPWLIGRNVANWLIDTFSDAHKIRTGK